MFVRVVKPHVRLRLKYLEFPPTDRLGTSRDMSSVHAKISTADFKIVQSFSTSPFPVTCTIPAMAAAKRAAEAEPVESQPTKRTRIDTPVSSPSQSGTHEDASSVAETSATAASNSYWRLKQYICQYAGCGKAFDRPIKLQTHTNTHTGEKPYACAEEGCDKKFYKAEHLRTHMKNIHAPSEHVCTYIIKVDDDGHEWECSKSFTTKTRLQRHVATHEAKEERKCEHCGQAFRKMETLQRHVEKDHLRTEEPFRCKVIIPHNGNQLHQEVEDALEDALEDGEECGQTFTSAGKLQRHKDREHVGRKHFCTICSSSIPVNAHDLGVTTPALSNDPDDISSPFQPVQLTYFTNYNELRAHMREEHPPTCTSCGKLCASNNALKAHIDIHHGSLSERQVHPCTWPDCDRSFTKKGNLNIHIQTAHVKAKKYVCGEVDLSKSARVAGWDGDGCGLALGTKASLEGHVQTQHLGFARPLRVNQMKKKIKREAENDDIQDLMPFLDLDESTPTDSVSSTTTPGHSDPLSLLTGARYADARPIACLLANEGCQHRFLRQYDLAQHMDKVHGWGVIDEGLPAHESLEYGNGVEDMFEDPAAEPDWDAMQKDYSMPKAGYDMAPQFLGLDDMFGEEAMALDPALRGM